MLFRRNNRNQCGIASHASYPIVKKNNSPSPSPSPSPTTSSPTTKPTSNPTTATTSTRASSTLSTTTIKPIVTTRSQSVQCNTGTGWYTLPGCKTAYYCTQTIKNYECPSQYLFDSTSGSCKLATNFKCNL